MDKPDTKVLEQALKLRKEGRKLKEILELTGLNYSQAWLYITDAMLPTSQRVKSKDATALNIKAMRDNEENSWGLISVRLGYTEFPESKVRKMYEEASGLKSQGLRIGHGGRYLNGDPILYADDRRRPGIQIPKGTKRSELHEISEALLNGKARPKKATAATKKAAAKKTGAVKTAKVDKPKPTKKAVRAMKRTGKPAPVMAAAGADDEVDPFA